MEKLLYTYQTILSFGHKLDIFLLNLPILSSLNSFSIFITNTFHFRYEYDQMYSLIVCCCFLPPSVIIYRLIPYRWYHVKHIYQFLFGVFILFTMFLSGALVIIGIALMGWVLLKSFKPRIGRYVNFIILFVGVVGLLHVYEEWNYYGVLRIGIPLTSMPVILKILSISFGRYDYERKKKGEKLTSERHEEVVIEKFPSFLQYMSYLFFFGVPNVEYAEYISSVESKEYIPIYWKDAWRVAKWSMFYGSFMVIFHLLGYHDFTSRYELTKDKSVMHTLYLGIICSRQLLTRLAAPLVLGELLCIITGIGYTKKHKYKYVQCMNPYVFETTPTVQKKITMWNMTIERWLRFQVYFRLPFKSKLTRRLITALSAAYWHGFYPGYFLMWISAMILSTMYLQIDKKIVTRLFGRTQEERNKPVYKVLKVLVIIFNQILHCYMLVSFVNLTWAETVLFYNRFNWIPQIICLILFFIMILIPYPKKRIKED